MIVDAPYEMLILFCNDTYLFCCLEGEVQINTCR